MFIFFIAFQNKKSYICKKTIFNYAKEINHIPVIIPDQIQYQINRYANPQKSAFIKGLMSDLNIKNPYLECDLQIKSKKCTFRRSFKFAFNHGRRMKIKYNFLIQLTLW